MVSHIIAFPADFHIYCTLLFVRSKLDKKASSGNSDTTKKPLTVSTLPSKNKVPREIEFI